MNRFSPDQKQRQKLSYLQRLEDGPPVGGQFGVGGLAEELGEGGDGVQLVCGDLRQNVVSATDG